MNINKLCTPCTPLTQETSITTLQGQNQEQIQAQIQAQNNDALLVAIEQIDVSEVKRLLTLGVDPNSQDIHGISLLEKTLQLFDTQKLSTTEGSACSLVQLLIEHGASCAQPIQNQYLNIFDYAIAKVNYGLLFSLHRHYTFEIEINPISMQTFLWRCEPKEFVLIDKYYPNLQLRTHLISELLKNHKNLGRHKCFFKKYHLFANDCPLAQLLIIVPEDTEILLGKNQNAPIKEALYLLAAGTGNVECLHTLLSHGVDVHYSPDSFPTGSFPSALNMAVDYKNTDFLFELQKIKGTHIVPRPSLHEAILANNLVKIEKELVSFDLNTRDVFGDTALMTAIRYHIFPAVKLLAQQPPLEDLFFAARYSNVEIVHFLVDIIQPDEENIHCIFNIAKNYKNKKVATYLLEKYASKYPRTFVFDFLSPEFGTKSFDFLQNFVQEMSKNLDTRWYVGHLFIQAIENKLSKFSYFLFDKIDDFSFFDNAVEDDIAHFYSSLFEHCEAEFVEKVIEKFGFHDTCFLSDDIINRMIDNQEPLFTKALPQLYKRAQSLFTIDKNNYFTSYAIIAMCSTHFEVIEELSTIAQKNDKLPWLPSMLLTIAIKRKDKKMAHFLLSSKLILVNGYKALYKALKVGDEGVIHTVVEWFTKKQIPINFVTLYELFYFKKNKKYLVQVLKLQRPGLSPSEREEIASLITEITKKYSSCAQVIAQYLQSEKEISKIMKALNQMICFYEKLFHACVLPLGRFTIEQTGDWFLGELFCRIGKVNPNLIHEDTLFTTMATRLSTMQDPDEYLSLLNSVEAPYSNKITAFPPLKMKENRDTEGRTELYLAVQAMNFSEVKVLLLLGADPNSTDREGVSVLEMALVPFTGDSPLPSKIYSLIQALVAKGAFCTRRIGSHLNIFDFAFATRNFGLLFALHRYYKPSIRLSDTALTNFIMSCKEQDLSFLMKYYPTIELDDMSTSAISSTLSFNIQEPPPGLFPFLQKLLLCSIVPYERRSISDTTNWLIEQIFSYCRPMNPALFSDVLVFDTIVELVAQISKNEDYHAFIVALQVAPNKEMATGAFLTARNLEEGSLVKPTKEQFLQRGEEEQKRWLFFALVYRDRSFIPHCYYLIKHHDKFPSLLHDALDTIQHIGVTRYNSKLENSLAVAIQNVLQTYQAEKIQAEKIKIAALKAYMRTDSLSQNGQRVDVLLLQLLEARKNNFISLEIELVGYLGTLHEGISIQEGNHLVDLLIIGLESHHVDVRYHTALALTAIPHEKGLFAACKVVQSSTWDRMLPHFGKNSQFIIGSFLHFRSYPEALHNNRHAVIKRIRLQLVRLYEKSDQFRTRVEQYPDTSKILQEVELFFKAVSKNSVRYVPVVFAYPPNTHLIRGLSTRKGTDKFRKSIKDLIRKGSGSSELTDYDTNVYNSTWNKIGHIFASHNKDLYFGKEAGCPYFSVDPKGVISESALVIFPASYYEKEYLAGQARLEHEGTFNNVLYRGIPHQWIKAIYLPEKYKKDIEMLAGNSPLENALKELTSDLFTQESIKELEVFRRHLLSKELDMTQEKATPVSFVEKIKYLPQVNVKKVEELLINDGVLFASEEELKKETAKLSIQVKLLSDDRLYTQDHWLRNANDKVFKEHANLFFDMLPESMHPLTTARKLMLGEEGFFGLCTDRHSQKRAVMRVAALLICVGKTVEDLVNPVFYSLTKQDLPLVALLLRYSTIETSQDVRCFNKAEWLQAFEQLKEKNLSFEAFCDMQQQLSLIKTSLLQKSL